MASLGYSDMPPERVCNSLKSLGYDGVEWTLSQFSPRTVSAADRRRLVEITHDAGLEVSELCVQQDLVSVDDTVRQDRISFVLETIVAAAEVGINVLNLFTGPAPWVPTAPRIPDDISEETAWQMVLDAFDQFIPIAKKHGVTLAVEGVWGHLCHDFYTTWYLIDYYRSDHLGVNFDPSHDILAENLHTGWIIRQWGKERIKHIHLKDAAGVPVSGKFLFPLLGEGLVPWSEVFAALQIISYDGFMSVEFESFAYLDQILAGDIEEAARMSMQSIRKLEALADHHTE